MPIYTLSPVRVVYLPNRLPRKDNTLLSLQPNLFTAIKYRNSSPSVALRHHLPYFSRRVFPGHHFLHRESCVFFLFVVRTDPALCHETLCYFNATWKAGIDITAQPPGIFDAIKGM